MPVKAKRVDAGYELTLGEHKVVAERQPDLYFVIELDGEKHKGYLKDLKQEFEAWVGGATVQQSPKNPTKEERAGHGLLKEVDRDEDVQKWIDQADTREEHINRWVEAYNVETVAVSMGKQPRRVFLLGKDVDPEPPLKQCYSKLRDQYTWPHPCED